MSKYEPWTRFLRGGDDEVTLTLDQLQQLVPDMAKSASLDNRWWGNNDPSHSHCRAWADAGYDAHPNFARRTVTFRRVK